MAIDLFGCSYETSRSEAQRRGMLKSLQFAVMTGLTLRRWLLSLHQTAGVRAAHQWGFRVSFCTGHHPTPPSPTTEGDARVHRKGISITARPLETSGSQVNSETISCNPHLRFSWRTSENRPLLWLALLRFSRIPGSRSLNLEWLTLSGQTSELGGRLTESSGFHERPRLSFGKRQ